MAAFLAALMSSIDSYLNSAATIVSLDFYKRFAILLIGILWRRATGNAALIALLCGIGTAISLYALNQPVVFEALGWEPLFRIREPFLYFSIWAFAVTAVILVVLSLLGGPVPVEKLQFVFGGQTEAPYPDSSELSIAASDAGGAKALPYRDYSSSDSQSSDLRAELVPARGTSVATIWTLCCLRILWIRRPSSIKASETTVTISQLSELN